MRIEARRRVAARPEQVWAVASDPCAIGSLSDTFIIEELEPGSTPAVGTRYRALLEVGPVPVGGNVEIIEFNPPCDMAWTTLTGVDHRLRIRIRDHPDGGSWLSVRFGYDSPGLLGSVADLASFPVVRRAVHDLLREMVEHVERSA